MFQFPLSSVSDIRDIFFTVHNSSRHIAYLSPTVSNFPPLAIHCSICFSFTSCRRLTFAIYSPLSTIPLVYPFHPLISSFSCFPLPARHSSVLFHSSLIFFPPNSADLTSIVDWAFEVHSAPFCHTRIHLVTVLSPPSHVVLLLFVVLCVLSLFFTRVLPHQERFSFTRQPPAAFFFFYQQKYEQAKIISNIRKKK